MNAIYIIESDPMLSAVKAHIDEKRRVRDAVTELAKSYGAERISTDRMDGTLRCVVFKAGAHHPEFTKPKGRDQLCWPKKGTEAAKRFAAQAGYANPTVTIASTFGVPLSLRHEDDQSSGWTRIGNILTECGFLWLGKAGPFALWIPDVEAEIAALAERGHKAKESFDMHLPGCRRILNEEWDLMVAQYELDQKRAAIPVPA